VLGLTKASCSCATQGCCVTQLLQMIYRRAAQLQGICHLAAKHILCSVSLAPGATPTAIAAFR
jgi:hypothetical protein